MNTDAHSDQQLQQGNRKVALSSETESVEAGVSLAGAGRRDAYPINKGFERDFAVALGCTPMNADGNGNYRLSLRRKDAKNSQGNGNCNVLFRESLP